MTTHVGLGIARNAVRAVVVRHHRITWAGEAPLGSLDELQTTIAGLLAQAPMPRWPRPVVHAAVGLHAAQVKRLVGLPDIPQADTLAAVVREAAGTYFLRNGIPLLTTGVRPAGPGIAVVGALERPYIDAIQTVCVARGYRLGAIVPTAIALMHSLQDSSFRWSDGTLTVEVNRSGPSIESVRTRPALPSDAEAVQLTPVPALATLTGDSVRYADAFGAAALDSREPVAIRSVGNGHLRSLARLGGVVVAGALILGLSPLTAKWAGNRAEQNVAQVRPGRWKVITATVSQLDRVKAVLRQADAFRSARTSLSHLLGELARALPEHTAALQFDWLGDRAELTVLTEDPSAVLAAIRRVPGIAKVELVGPMNQQSAGGKDLQRVMIRFVKAGAAR